MRRAAIQRQRNRTSTNSNRLVQLAEHGDSQAQFELGRVLDAQSPPNRRLAVRWYRLAARSGHIEAANMMGESLRDGLGVRRDGAAALAWFQIAAEGGSSSAQLSFGFELFQGKLVRRDRRAALAWYMKAARRGELSARFNIAQMYERGEGVIRDLRRARYWYATAARRGHSGAARRLAEMMNANVHTKRQALFWLRESARLGDARSICDLGVHLHNGDGLKKNLRLAAKCYERAALAGDAWARYLLGLSYRDGEGVKRDRRKAAKWLLLAAPYSSDARRALKSLRAR
jgi:uncharacterized protein